MDQKKTNVAIQFFPGIDELSIPEIRLTRSKDGRSGQAIFLFNAPEALTFENYKDIRGMYLIDEEGQITTREINIRIVNGKKSSLEAKYTWKSEADFIRFMRFAERYAKSYDLGYENT